MVDYRRSNGEDLWLLLWFGGIGIELRIVRYGFRGGERR